MEKQPIYLDFQATTPMDRRVFEAMAPFFLQRFGNPHAEENLYGQAAAAAVGRARDQVAGLLNCDAREIFFTSGATEGNNILIQGAARQLRAEGRTHLVTCATEHKSVLEPMDALRREGFTVTVLPVAADGRLSAEAVQEALQPETGLVSIMAANNEIGVLQPLKAIASVCQERGVLFHTDAAQAIGKVQIDLADLQVDLLSLSGHKIYGPMGIGAIYVRRSRRLRPLALMQGGAQEGGLRPGTVPTPLVVGLGEACEVAGREFEQEGTRLLALRRRLIDALGTAGLTFDINGDLDHRLPGNLNLSFDGVDAEALLMTLRGDLAMSTGSACTASSLEPSHVVRALGFGTDRAESAIRIGLGRTTTQDEVDAAAASLVAAVRRLSGIRYRHAAAVSGRA